MVGRLCRYSWGGKGWFGNKLRAQYSVAARLVTCRRRSLVTQVAQRMGFAEAFPYTKSVKIFREHARLSGFENAGKRTFDISALAKLDDVNTMRCNQCNGQSTARHRITRCACLPIGNYTELQSTLGGCYAAARTLENIQLGFEGNINN